MTSLSRLVLTASLALLPCGARADVQLHPLFSEHAVLQRDHVVPVWGWADPGEEVTVSLAGHRARTAAGADGRWLARLPRMAAAEGLTLTVQGRNTLTVPDVHVGEVWLCSGQSNMAWPVSRSRDFEKERAAAAYPKIRMFTVGRTAARVPQERCAGSWQVCSPETVGAFSAAAYFFGREIQAKLGVPVGLINSSVGGTPIEAWTSAEAQYGVPELEALFTRWDQRAAEFNPLAAWTTYHRRAAAHPTAVARARAEGRPVPQAPRRPEWPRSDVHHPAVQFNGMIAPLVPYALRGALWYQGEANAGTEESGALYRLQLRLLVEDWRSRWGQGDIPFAWVQLPNFRTPARGWPAIRESMLRALELPNTGMTVNIDIGDPGDIHPASKQEVGRRLALWARARVYGEALEWSGPLPAAVRARGAEMVVRFTHAEGLQTAGGEPRGFEVAGKDGKWKRARARVEGRKVIAWSEDVPRPVAVRYAWEADPDGNLVNAAGLPASPFRGEE